ncbi:Nn.00g056630.m01.CDS01 [Neocucurbitaria sp. VM-36]
MDIQHEESERLVMEGEQPQGMTNGTMVMMQTMYGEAGKEVKSYVFAPDPNKPAWVAFTMSWTYLSCLVICSLALAIGQELLYRKSQRRSGLLWFKTAQDISKLEYFLWRYAPTILTVNYGIAFQAVDAQVRRLEPFYRLARKGGATAAESIGVDPTKPWALLSMLGPRTFFSTIAFLTAVLAVPTLQNASLSVAHSTETDNSFIYIVNGWSRGLTSALLLNAACTATIMFYTRKGSGLWDDPGGIVGHCAMLTKSHILEDMEGLEMSKDRVILNALRQRKYVLHKGSLWQGEYIPNAPTLASDRKTDDQVDTRQPMLRPIPAGIFLVLQLAVLALVPSLTFSSANYLLQKVPWILTALGVTVKLIWSLLDGTMRSLEPWYRLSRRHAPPSVLCLDYTATSIYKLPFKALSNRHYLLFCVSIVSLLAELLIVCISSFGLKGTAFLHGTITSHGTFDRDADDVETFASFWWSFGISITVLILMMFGTSLVFYHRHQFILPRAPGTIASIIAYTYQGHLLISLVDTEEYSKAERLTHLNNDGYTYGFGWYTGRNGEVICGIDQEPLLAGYQHGVDFKATMHQD